MKLEFNKDKVIGEIRTSLPYMIVPALATLTLSVLVYGQRREAKGYSKGYRDGSAAGYGHGCVDGFNAAADREAVQQLSSTIEKNLGAKLKSKI